MNRDRWTGRLKQLGGGLKERWGVLTGDPLMVAAGRRASHEGKVQEQWAAARQAADRQLKEFTHRNRNWLDLSGH